MDILTKEFWSGRPAKSWIDVIDITPGGDTLYLFRGNIIARIHKNLVYLHDTGYRGTEIWDRLNKILERFNMSIIEEKGIRYILDNQSGEIFIWKHNGENTIDINDPISQLKPAEPKPVEPGFVVGDTVIVKSTNKIGRIKDILADNKALISYPDSRAQDEIHNLPDLEFKWHINIGDLVQLNIKNAPNIFIEEQFDNNWMTVLRTDEKEVFKDILCIYNAFDIRKMYISDLHIKKHIPGGLQVGDKIKLKKDFHSFRKGETVEVFDIWTKDAKTVAISVKDIVGERKEKMLISDDLDVIDDIIREVKKEEEITVKPKKPGIATVSADAVAVSITMETKNKTDWFRGDTEEIILIKNNVPDDIKNGKIKVLKIMKDKKTKKIVGFETEGGFG